jgi:chromate reductase, NAD(P)H dehydrogenase (quinone)
MTSTPLHIVGLCGSLRRSSYNRMALELAGASLPAGASFEVLDWRSIPAFDADRMSEGFPQAVTALAERIRAADGVVIATPEYNFTLPGMFKNALDWLSRLEQQPFAGKPLALLSAATGPLGGARVQYDLRRVMMFLNAMPLVKPEVFIGQAQTKFDADGACTDEATRKFVGDQMRALQDWILAVRRMRA